jgi:hypothetical protein
MYPDEIIDTCVSMYQDEYSCHKVARCIGVSHVSVERWAREQGVLRTRQEADKIQSINLKGIRRNPNTEFRKGQKPWNVGLKMPNISGENHWTYNIGNIHTRGDKNPNWKGGVTKENERQRKSLEYKAWRKAVLYKDKYTCQECGQIGGKLTAHHVKPFAKEPMLRLSILNGMTLCQPCHAEQHPDLNYKSLVGSN